MLSTIGSERAAYSRVGKVTLVSALFLLFTTSLLAQQVFRQTVSYTPAEKGFELRVPFAWKFIDCAGDVMLTIDMKKGDATATGYIHKGSRYTSADIGAEAFADPDIGYTVISGTVYHQSYTLGRVQLTNVISAWGGCYGQTYAVIKMLGLSNEQYKDKLGELYFRDLRIESTSSWDYDVEKLIDSKERNATINEKTAAADQALASGDKERAKELYEEVQDLDYSNSHANSKLDEIEQLEEEEAKKELHEEHMSEGDRLMQEGDLEGAEAAYKKAKSTGVDEAEADSKLADVEEEQQAKVEEAKKAEEEAAKAEESEESSEESGSEEEEEEEKSYEELKREVERQEREAAEARKRLAEKEEFERQQRVIKYQQEKFAQTQQNMQAAGAMSGSAIAMLIQVGTMIYEGIGIDRPENKFRGTSRMMHAHLGYTVTSMPMFTNSEMETYDGNNYGSSNETENHQSNLIELEGGLELYPLVGDNYDVGVFANARAGFGLLFQNFGVSYDYGAKGSWGLKNFKMAGSVSKGYRSFAHIPWINAQEFGSGKLTYRYTRMAIGPRISWSSDMWGDTRAHLDIQPVMELPSYQTPTAGNEPVMLIWANGLRTELWAENRIRIFAEYFWHYPRDGEVNHGYAEDASPQGTFIRFGVTRSWDMFGQSSFALDYQQVLRMNARRNKWAIIPFKGTMSWVDPREDSTYFVGDYVPGASLLLEKDINLLPQIAIATGVGGSYIPVVTRAVNGQPYTIEGRSFGSSANVKLEMFTIDVPAGLRFTSSPRGKDVYWVKGSLNHHLVLHRMLGTRAVASVESYEKSPASKQSGPKMLRSLEAAAGLDFPTPGNTNMRVSIGYERYLTPLWIGESHNQRMESFSVSTGFIF